VVGEGTLAFATNVGKHLSTEAGKLLLQTKRGITQARGCTVSEHWRVEEINNHRAVREKMER
jgi:hypothetical protein